MEMVDMEHLYKCTLVDLLSEPMIINFHPFLGTSLAAEI